MEIKCLDKWKVGDYRSLKKVATKECIETLAAASGDYNPIHLDQKYAESTKFGRCIAHALFCLGMVSNLIGMEIPGEGAVFLNESVEYIAPVYIDDEIETKVVIQDIIIDKKIFIIEFYCINQNKELILKGKTDVKMIARAFDNK